MRPFPSKSRTEITGSAPNPAALRHAANELGLFSSCGVGTNGCDVLQQNSPWSVTMDIMNVSH